MSEQNKFDSTYSTVVSMAEQMVGEGKYDSTYSAVLAIYQNLTSDMDTKFDSVYSIVVKIADGIESGEIDPSGGGGSDEPVNYNTHKFYNVNGELVEEWTLEETQSKTELPVVSGVPFNDWTLDFDGWNWDLEQLKSASCGQNVGAMYRPSDGKTRIVVDIAPENLTYVLFVDGDYTIDWGDGIIESEWDTTYPTHTYESEGSKTITLTGTDIRPQWGVAPIHTHTQEGFPVWYYTSRVKTFMSGGKLDMLAFGYCTELEYLTFTDDDYSNIDRSNYIKFTDCFKIKCLCLPKGVKYFSGTKGAEVVCIPNSVTTSFSVNEAVNLKSINIPDSITGAFGDGSFSSLYNLEFINLGKGFSNSSLYAKFKDDYKLKSVKIFNTNGGGTTNVFQNCKNLKHIDFPEGITSIASNSCQGCYLLESVNIPDGVTSIESSAFQDCYSLMNIDLPDSLTSIGANAFKYCNNLQSVMIPYGTTTIANYAFSNCAGLQHINIPSTVNSLGAYVFNGCYSLQSVEISEGVTELPQSTFYECKNLKTVNLPDSITSIGQSSFYRNSNLNYIKMPAQLNYIGERVFSLTYQIVIDFSNCTQVPELASTNAFDSTAIILVPESLYDEWIVSTNWSSLSSQIKAV